VELAFEVLLREIWDASTFDEDLSDWDISNAKVIGGMSIAWITQSTSRCHVSNFSVKSIISWNVSQVTDRHE